MCYLLSSRDAVRQNFLYPLLLFPVSSPYTVLSKHAWFKLCTEWTEVLIFAANSWQEVYFPKMLDFFFLSHHISLDCERISSKADVEWETSLWASFPAKSLSRSLDQRVQTAFWMKLSVMRTLHQPDCLLDQKLCMFLFVLNGHLTLMVENGSLWFMVHALRNVVLSMEGFASFTGGEGVVYQNTSL